MTASQAFEKDAEAAGRYVLAYLRPRRKGEFGASVEVIGQVARWAGHWGRRALEAAASEGQSA